MWWVEFKFYCKHPIVFLRFLQSLQYKQCHRFVIARCVSSMVNFDFPIFWFLHGFGVFLVTSFMHLYIFYYFFKFYNFGFICTWEGLCEQLLFIYRCFLYALLNWCVKANWAVLIIMYDDTLSDILILLISSSQFEVRHLIPRCRTFCFRCNFTMVIFRMPNQMEFRAEMPEVGGEG